MQSHLVRLLGRAVLLSVFFPRATLGQARLTPKWEIRGFDFRPDGVLRVRARAVRAYRARLLSAGLTDALNAPMTAARSGMMLSVPQASAAAVTGVLNVPAILFRFKDSPAPKFGTASYDSVLFSTVPPPGRPETYRTYYQDLSNGVFDVQGKTYGYANLDSNEVFYTGGTSSVCASENPFGSTNCNGLFSQFAVQQMQLALTQALQKMDATVDFSQYVDTASGFVPLVLFMHEAMGGECGPSNAPQNHLWAHRFSLQSTFTTNDPWPGHAGQFVKISDYVLQSGVGGASSCDTSQVMPIGTVAHETGHGFGLVDLYDVSGASEGIGQWSLMSSGNFTSAFSPSRMDAWSLNYLGWVTLAPITTTGTYTFDAAPLSDTTFFVRVPDPNPRGEYFLLENRQRQQSDSAMIRIHCQKAGNPPGCGGGLLIYHADSAKIDASLFSNTVNAGAPHGLEIVQADAFGNLDAQPVGGNFCPSTSISLGCSDRGDAGDVYPGTTGNTRLIYHTNPAALKNVDGSFVGFAVDSVRQLITDRTMAFRLRFGGLTVVRASDTAAVVGFDSATVHVFRDMLEQGASYSVSVTDPQISSDGRTRWHFASWSDGGAASHTFSGNVLGDTLTATLTRDFKLIATHSTGGTIQSDTAIDLTNGTFIKEGRSVTLTAIADSGQKFGGWSGDTVTLNTVVVLPMGRPYTLLATFGTLAISSPATRPNGVMGAAYSDTLRTTGGTGSNSWAITSGALPTGLTLDAPSGVISGFPHQTGNFSYTATVTSGAQSQSQAFTMSVTAPTLATADVVTALLGPGNPLTADQLRYLDFLGNNNGSFDVGDFLAWVKATGAPLSPAVLQALSRRKGGAR